MLARGTEYAISFSTMRQQLAEDGFLTLEAGASPAAVNMGRLP